MRKVLVFLLAFLLANPAWAASTIDPTIPAAGSALSSAPIRANFAAAANDVNHILNAFSGTTPPASPTPFQYWANTSTTPVTLSQWDGTTWITVATIDTTGHAYGISGTQINSGTVAGARLQIFGTSNSGAVPTSPGGTTTFLRADGQWIAPAGSGGNVNSGVTLTTNGIVLGAGTNNIGVMASLGTTTTLLHGNAAGAPTFGAVNLAADVSGTLPGANVQTFGTANAGAVPASGGGTTNFLRADGNWAAVSGGSGNVNAGGTLTTNALVVGAGTTNVAALASLGTTATVLHGNAAGLPTFGALNLATDTTGILPSASLPNPTSSTLGGIESFAAVSNQWIKSISTSGVPASTQPTFADISGSITSAQCPLATTGAFGCVKPDGSSVTVSAGVISAPGSGGGTVLSGTAGQFAGYATSSTTVQGYTFGTTFTVDNTNHTVIMTTPDSTKSADYTFTASDMGGTVNLTGTHNLTFPAVSAGPPPIWGIGQASCYANQGVGNWTVITTPTINGLPSTTIFPGGGGCVVSNGTTLDWQPGKAGDEARLNVANTWNAVQTFSTPIVVASGGSGAGTFTAHGVLLGEATSAFVPTAAMTNGQLLVGQTGADPLPKTITGDWTLSAAGAASLASSLALGGSPTTTTQSANDNSMKVATTAYVDRPVSVATPAASHTFAGKADIFYCSTTCTITVPVPAAGVQYCVANNVGVSTVITLSAIGSSARYGNTAQTAYGTAGTGTAVSGGAAADKLCITGVDSTHYNTSAFNGTWTMS